MMPYRQLLIATLTLSLAGPALAAGSSSSSTRSTTPSDYTQAVKAVKAQRFRQALDLLAKTVRAEPGNADAWNYIGFSNRKLNRLDKALAAYRKALAIDPEHRGANEYLGELYLQTGEITKAKAQLEKLDKICTFGCEEYDDLKAALRAYQSG